MDGAAPAPFSEVARERLAWTAIASTPTSRISPRSGASRRTPRLTTRATCARSPTSAERGNLPDWKSLDSQHVRMFAARSHAGGLSPRSVQRRLSAVRGFFNYLRASASCASNPARGRARAEGGAGACPARSTSTSSISCSTSRPRTRWRCATAPSWSCSIHRDCGSPSSWASTWPQLDLADRTVRVLGKGRKTRIVPVGRKADRSAARWLRERAALAAPDETALFVGKNGTPPQAPRHPAAHRVLGTPQGPAGARASAPVPAFVRHASA